MTLRQSKVRSKKKTTANAVVLSLCGEHSNAASTQSAAEVTSLAPHGVGRGCDWKRIAEIHGEAMYTAPTLRSACSYSSCKLPMLGGEGFSPRLSLGDLKGDTLFEKRVSPFICPFPRSAEISVPAPVQVYFLKLSFSVTDRLNTR